LRDGRRDTLDTYDLLMKRRSVRNYQDRPVPESVLEKLLNAANNAPTGGNIQPLSIVVVEDSDDRAELADMVGGQPWVKNGPVSLLFCLDFHRVKRWAEMFNVEFLGERCLGSFLIAYADVMCAAQTVVLLAEGLGLGSVYVGTIQSNLSRARGYFGMPEGVLPLMVLTLGYPKSVPRGIRKLPAELVVHRSRYRVLDDDTVRDAFESKYGSVDDHIDAYFERSYVEVLEADKQHEERWSERAKQRMKSLGIKSNAEFLFRLRYPQRVMMGMNADLAEELREAGFDFPGIMSEPPDTAAD
jgi:nitroreductase